MYGIIFRLPIKTNIEEVVLRPHVISYLISFFYFRFRLQRPLEESYPIHFNVLSDVILLFATKA